MVRPQSLSKIDELQAASNRTLQEGINGVGAVADPDLTRRSRGLHALTGDSSSWAPGQGSVLPGGVVFTPSTLLCILVWYVTGALTNSTSKQSLQQFPKGEAPWMSLTLMQHICATVAGTTALRVLGLRRYKPLPPAAQTWGFYRMVRCAARVRRPSQPRPELRPEPPFAPLRSRQPLSAPERSPASLQPALQRCSGCGGARMARGHRLGVVCGRAAATMRWSSAAVAARPRGAPRRGAEARRARGAAERKGRPAAGPERWQDATRSEWCGGGRSRGRAGRWMTGRLVAVLPAYIPACLVCRPCSLHAVY